VLKANMPLVEDRDDLYLERIWLENILGNYRLANDLLLARKFHPWEGGEGKVVGQYLFCQLMLAMEALRENDASEAERWLNNTIQYPYNLGEGKLYGTPENDIHYLRGMVHQLMGKPKEAASWFRLATKGNAEPKPALFYNDPQPDKILYQGLSWIKLGEKEKASTIFRGLIAYGNKHMHDNVQVDYFAVSLPDTLVFEKDLNKSNQLHCTYMMGLGELGMGNFEEASTRLQNVLQLDACHLGALRNLKLIELLKSVEDATPGLGTPMTTADSIL
jgi:tetratricopeptide (TPR) repeat protein